MGNLRTRERSLLWTHVATATSPTTTTNLVVLELPTQDSPGAAEHDTSTTPIPCEHLRTHRWFSGRGNYGGPRGCSERYNRGRGHGGREYGNQGYRARRYGDRDQDYHRSLENSSDDREPICLVYTGRSYGDRQNCRGDNRGYGRGTNYSD